MRPEGSRYRGQWLYNLLFRCASETLLELAADPKHLGARIGVLAVLHTWSQKLTLHPHLHCIVTGGGLSIDGDWWVGCRLSFFLSVRVLRSLKWRRPECRGLRPDEPAVHSSIPMFLCSAAEPGSSVS